MHIVLKKWLSPCREMFRAQAVLLHTRTLERLRRNSFKITPIIFLSCILIPFTIATFHTKNIDQLLLKTFLIKPIQE
jgi:hypothetical protein